MNLLSTIVTPNILLKQVRSADLPTLQENSYITIQTLVLSVNELLEKIRKSALALLETVDFLDRLNSRRCSSCVMIDVEDVILANCQYICNTVTEISLSIVKGQNLCMVDLLIFANQIFMIMQPFGFNPDSRLLTCSKRRWS